MDPEHELPTRSFRHQLNACLLQVFSSTQSYTAECEPGGAGADATVERTATSNVSQADADAKALFLARQEAETELACVWTSTQCVVTGSTVLGSAIFCATRTSDLSQADADAKAMAAAQALVP